MPAGKPNLIVPKERVCKRMNRTQYRDLPELGLTLVTPNDPNFEALVRDIESRRHPFDTMQFGDMDSAAVLMNGSGKTIVVFCYLWRYTTAEGATRTSSTSNLGSSTQWDVLTGGSEDVQDLGTFILPGSKRLITEEGMFGNSLDVLPPSHPSHGRFSMGAGGGGRRFRRRQREDSIAATELSLDLGPVRK